MKKKINPIDEQQCNDYFDKRSGGKLSENYFDFFDDSIKNAKSFSIGPYLWFITNTTKMRIEYISKNIEQFTPFKKEDWMDSRIDFFANLFHPQDRAYLMAAFVFSDNVRLQLLREGRTEISFNFYGRMINRDGEYR